MIALNECDKVADLPISGHLAGRPMGWCRFLGNYMLFTGADRTSCTLHDCRMKVGSVEPLSDGAGFVVQLREGEELRESDTFRTFELALERLWDFAVDSHAAERWLANCPAAEVDPTIPF